VGNLNRNQPAEIVPRVGAVIVIYNPVLAELQAQFAAVCQQVAVVIVVNNGSCSEVAAWFEEQRHNSLEVISPGENLGIAAAQNLGACRAWELGCTHLLLLDQDSVPTGDMLAKLLEVEKVLLGKGEKVGAIGSRFVDPTSGRETWFHGRGLIRYRYLKCSGKPGDEVVRADMLIASGTLIRKEAWVAVGGMDESLFIDLVDTEWCLRATVRGYSLWGSAAFMYHSIGNREITLPGKPGRRGSFPVHAPLRYYYMFRNSLLLIRRSSIPGWWKINNTMELMFLLACLPFMPSARLSVLSMIVRGVADGILTRHGRYIR